MNTRFGAVRSARPARIHSVLALAVAAALCAANAMAAPDALPSVAKPTRLQTGDAIVGALPMKQPIHVEVALKLRDRPRLEAFVEQNSRNQARGIFAEPMTTEQFLARHAPTVEQARAVADYLARTGYTNITIAPNRLLVSADGTAETARNAFMTSFALVRTHEGRMAWANRDEARIPASLSDTVLSVVGLQSVHIAHTFVRQLDPGMVHTHAVTGHQPTDFASIYGAGASAAAKNVTVGIVTQGSLVQVKKDLNSFTAAHGLPAVVTVTINTHGTSGDTAGLPEWDLDSQDIIGITGGVKQLNFYNIPTLLDTDLTADFNTIVSANKAKIINVSLGECELDAQGDGSATAQDQLFLTAVAKGQTFSVSTGDTGADECGDGTNTPSWPASSRYVVAVTGTTLDATSTTYSSESVWGHSGGSPSTFEAIPTWQQDFGIAGTRRIAADVAFDGDPASGVFLVLNGTSTGLFAGTSLSAPLFAGVWARELQVRPYIGFAGPVLYALPTGDFHDVTTGRNSGGKNGIGYIAKVGYDNASGRGSLIIANLITDAATLGNKAPKANFSFTTSHLVAHFTDSSTDDVAVVSHSWDFGDGTTGTAVNPNHTYPAAGTYSVVETVKDGVGLSSKKTESVTVN
ncbi:MAG TPA: protease pro-enzyme activation domain-containing protein [Xanthomonadaceae bacterium]|jgi:subtilase family serine protease